MNILLAHKSMLPASTYGRSERVVWWLGKMLAKRGHTVYLLAGEHSDCPFAKVLIWNAAQPLEKQIPEFIDLVHLHHWSGLPLQLQTPWLHTVYDQLEPEQLLPANTVFLSHNHAHRYGGKVYIHPGIDLDEYGLPDTGNKRMYFHFNAPDKWTASNLQGAVSVTSKAGNRLHVIGGHRVRWSQGLRVMLAPHVRFHGEVGADGRNALVQSSKGLVRPILMHEAFSLSVIESLYFGCPVFGTPYGALPEQLGRIPAFKPNRKWQGSVEAFHSDYGVLTTSKSELTDALRESGQYNRLKCQEYAAAHFSAERMADEYLQCYEKILNGHSLHETDLLTPAGTEEKLSLR